MKQPDLKTCPFCGAPAVLKTYHQPIEHGPTHDEYFRQVDAWLANPRRVAE